MRMFLPCKRDSRAWLWPMKTRDCAAPVTIKASHATPLTTAVAELVFGCGLSFELAETYEFRRVLQQAKLVASGYVPPNKEQVRGPLLDIAYEKQQKETKLELLKMADVFGLCYYGDGATIGKKPLTNVMASGAFTQTAVLDIVDSSEHMAMGGIKDAAYIADMFEPHLKELDPLGKNSDLVLFDGASNVQKAGEIIGARHPRVSCLHAAEHVVSL